MTEEEQPTEEQEEAERSYSIKNSSRESTGFMETIQAAVSNVSQKTLKAFKKGGMSGVEKMKKKAKDSDHNSASSSDLSGIEFVNEVPAHVKPRPSVTPSVTQVQASTSIPTPPPSVTSSTGTRPKRIARMTDTLPVAENKAATPMKDATPKKSETSKSTPNKAETKQTPNKAETKETPKKTESEQKDVKGKVKVKVTPKKKPEPESDSESEQDDDELYARLAQNAGKPERTDKYV